MWCLHYTLCLCSYVVCYLGVLGATLPSVVRFYRSNPEFRTPLFVVQVKTQDTSLYIDLYIDLTHPNPFEQ